MSLIDAHLALAAAQSGSGAPSPAPVPAAPATLRYVQCDAAGIRRVRRGKGFRYITSGGAAVTSPRTLKRIAALAIPPAWENVWICPNPSGHLQATGIDSKGRKQYRYHAEWTAHRNLSKFDGLGAFARLLPRIRRRVRRDMALPGVPRDKVLACIVHLLDTAHIRIGNSEYARDNHSYGLTTIHNEHATVRGNDIRFHFRAKSGKQCDLCLHDPTAAAIVRTCQCLPGQELFAYKDERSRVRDVSSGDVNDYLHRISGVRITAKDFRTWGGTVVAAETLLRLSTRASADGRGNAAAKSPSPAEIKRAEVTAVRAASAALCNTVATSRKFYVHPSLIGEHASGSLARAVAAAKRARTPRELGTVERALAALLPRMAASPAATPTRRSLQAAA